MPISLTQAESGATGSAAMEAEILRLIALRGPEKSICPSEVARALADDGVWQTLMTPVRRVAIRLALAGRLDILRHGKPVAHEVLSGGELRGVIRLREIRPTDASSGQPVIQPSPTRSTE